MQTTTFTTMTDAINDLEVVLGEYVADFDVEAIADEVFEEITEAGQYRLQYRDLSEDEFWGIVASHDISE